METNEKMIYVALLRGVNVGGKGKVEMAKLRLTFETIGFTGVKTFINSGNVIFITTKPADSLVKVIEKSIEHDFGFKVPVLVRSLPQMEQLVEAIPDDWVNGMELKCDVLFLWPDIDSPKIIEQIPHNPKVDEIRYAPGAVLHKVGRDNRTKSWVVRIVGTPLHKQITIRNVNSTRKILTLMQNA